MHSLPSNWKGESPFAPTRDILNWANAIRPIQNIKICIGTFFKSSSLTRQLLALQNIRISTIGIAMRFCRQYVVGQKVYENYYFYDLMKRSFFEWAQYMGLD